MTEPPREDAPEGVPADPALPPERARDASPPEGPAASQEAPDAREARASREDTGREDRVPDGLGEAVASQNGAEPAEPPAAQAPEDTVEDASEEAEGPGLRASIEAILLVVDEPVSEDTLARLLERPRAEIAATLRELSAEYTAQGRGFDLREVGDGWRFYTRDVCAPVVERFVTDGQQARLTQAALETLAVVAYRQPVSRARVSAIRGVNSDGVMRTLMLRGLIEEAGRDPETQALLYRTTGYFLERLGLRSLDELPDLAPYLPEDLPDDTVEEK